MATITAVTSVNAEILSWMSNDTWVGGAVPETDDHVIIPAESIVDASLATIEGWVRVQGTLVFTNAVNSGLIVVESGGYLELPTGSYSQGTIIVEGGGMCTFAGGDNFGGVSVRSGGAAAISGTTESFYGPLMLDSGASAQIAKTMTNFITSVIAMTDSVVDLSESTNGYAKFVYYYAGAGVSLAELGGSPTQIGSQRRTMHYTGDPGVVIMNLATETTLFHESQFPLPEDVRAGTVYGADSFEGTLETSTGDYMLTKFTEEPVVSLSGEWAPIFTAELTAASPGVGVQIFRNDSGGRPVDFRVRAAPNNNGDPQVIPHLISKDSELAGETSMLQFWVPLPPGTTIFLIEAREKDGINAGEAEQTMLYVTGAY